MALRPLTHISLCSGYGGLDLALNIATGGRARTVCYVERESYAASIIVARMEDALLDQAPIWDDLCTFPSELYRGRVDIISAGFPCQPFSFAGSRKGLDDERWIWPAIVDIVRKVGPRFVFLENVRGVVRAGMSPVLGDLASLGFDAEWGVVSAGSVGASHRRERWFCLAYCQREQPERWRDAGDVDCTSSGIESEAQERERCGDTIGDKGSIDVANRQNERSAGFSLSTGRRAEGQGASDTDGSGSDVADASQQRSRESHNETSADSWEDARADSGRGGSGLADSKSLRGAQAERGESQRERSDTDNEAMADSCKPRLERRQSSASSKCTKLSEPKQRIPLFPPGPSDLDQWQQILEIDSSLKPAICGVDDGDSAGVDVRWRADRLRACGNGVVPLQGAIAFRLLAERAGIHELTQPPSNPRPKEKINA